jgi:hypothetical protein
LGGHAACGRRYPANDGTESDHELYVNFDKQRVGDCDDDGHYRVSGIDCELGNSELDGGRWVGGDYGGHSAARLHGECGATGRLDSDRNGNGHGGEWVPVRQRDDNDGGELHDGYQLRGGVGELGDWAEWVADFD